VYFLGLHKGAEWNTTKIMDELIVTQPLPRLPDYSNEDDVVQDTDENAGDIRAENNFNEGQRTAPALRGKRSRSYMGSRTRPVVAVVKSARSYIGKRSPGDWRVVGNIEGVRRIKKRNIGVELGEEKRRSFIGKRLENLEDERLNIFRPTGDSDGMGLANGDEIGLTNQQQDSRVGGKQLVLSDETGDTEISPSEHRSFIGKRDDVDMEENKHRSFIGKRDDVDMEENKRRSFIGKKDDVDMEENKRRSFIGKRNDLGMEENKHRSFIGKRDDLDMEEDKRRSFIGKRQLEQSGYKSDKRRSLIDKKKDKALVAWQPKHTDGNRRGWSLGTTDDERVLGSENWILLALKMTGLDEDSRRSFIGKRVSNTYEKRRAFIGKRLELKEQEHSAFIGEGNKNEMEKRRSFIGKREEDDLEKRRSFIGKRDGNEFEKRRSFIGKRDGNEFEKRRKRVGSEKEEIFY